jgi:hypothetical protein
MAEHALDRRPPRQLNSEPTSFNLARQIKAAPFA